MADQKRHHREPTESIKCHVCGGVWGDPTVNPLVMGSGVEEKSGLEKRSKIDPHGLPTEVN